MKTFIVILGLLLFFTVEESRIINFGVELSSFKQEAKRSIDELIKSNNEIVDQTKHLKASNEEMRQRLTTLENKKTKGKIHAVSR